MDGGERVRGGSDSPGASVSRGAAEPGEPRRRVLVMDDEPLVREAAGEILAHLGFEVSLAGDGEEALTAYASARERGSPFDAVLMDLLVSDGMDGEETLRALRRIDPTVRAVVSTGACEDPRSVEFRRHGFVGRLLKPYGADEVARAMSEALRGQVRGRDEADEPHGTQA